MSTCRFCGASDSLRVSHVLPAFVFRRLKKSSAGAIRSAETPNRRIQDGPKAELLCAKCEETFCEWEKPFAERVFVPFHEGKADIVPIPYREWALKFAVSVSWRVLEYFRELDNLANFREWQRGEAVAAAEHWRQFLQGTKPHPGRFEQHLLPLDLIASFDGGPLSPFINRYVSRTVDMDVVSSERSAMVYSKLGRLLLVGFITGQERSEWKETRLHVREGDIGGAKRYRIPPMLMKYINSKAKRAAERLASMSRGQTELVHRELETKAASGELLGTEILEAMQQDVQLFGDQAFAVTAREQQK